MNYYVACSCCKHNNSVLINEIEVLRKELYECREKNKTLEEELSNKKKSIKEIPYLWSKL